MRLNELVEVYTALQSAKENYINQGKTNQTYCKQICDSLWIIETEFRRLRVEIPIEVESKPE